jgi:predicted transposase/invertase (TIGR01784 family)
MIRLNPLNDYLFMKTMGEKGDEEQLLAFLNAVLKRTGRNRLESVEIIENKTLPAEVIGNKASVLDLRAMTDDGTRVNIEVQVRNLGNMDKRSLYYASREYTGSIVAGQDYIELSRVIAINIVDFEFIPKSAIADFHTSFHLWEDRNKDFMLTDALEIHFIEMPKFKKLADKDIQQDSLHRWLLFFDKTTAEETLTEVLNMDTAIQKAQERIAFVSSDKESLRLYEMREKALSDFISGMNFARREGLKAGEQRGKKEMARNMKAGGLSVEQIMAFSGLSRKDIEDR